MKIEETLKKGQLMEIQEQNIFLQRKKDQPVNRFVNLYFCLEITQNPIQIELFQPEEHEENAKTKTRRKNAKIEKDVLQNFENNNYFCFPK